MNIKYTTEDFSLLLKLMTVQILLLCSGIRLWRRDVN